jgi:alpha-beta hydrolase superfamily lysophospholipase
MFSPGMDGHPDTFSLGYRMKALLAAWTKPDSDIELPYTADLVTRSLSAREWINNDPDLRLTLPARMLWELLKMTRDTTGQAASVECPVLMFSAGYDLLVDKAINERVFKRFASTQTRHRVFPEAWHDLMFDPVIDELVLELTAWIKLISETQSQI